MILFCLSQCNFEWWAREEGLERPISSKPKPKSPNLKMDMLLKHASLKGGAPQSGVCRFEVAYTTVKVAYATLRHIPYIACFSIWVSTSHVGSWQGLTRVWEFRPCLPLPSISLYIHLHFIISKDLEILTKILVETIVDLLQSFGYISFLRDW